ncbi:MAG TPA: hypothetical protein PLV12_08750 [Saprospiraceae bacterium]|nr:hypothetical protein [Saprospiraceae bacterium]
MERKTIKYLFISLLFLNACYYDNEEELYPDVGTCITDSMSYQADIYPIINNNCLGCHNSSAVQGGIDISNYELLTPYIESGSLLKSIKHESGYSAMPKDAGKMSECQIAKIDAWISQGAPDN